MATFTMKFKNWEGIKTMVDNMTMDKQQAAREFDTYYESADWAAMGHCEQHEHTWQAAQAALMPVLVEARDAIIEARRNIDEVDNALADSFMWDALARLNTIIGENHE